jgi:enoyl-CoA hydratase
MSHTGEPSAIKQEALELPVYETLSLAVDAGVATVCLNRADKANSMNEPMWGELQSCFEWLDSEPSVRVAILAGNGKHFCAGIDLSLFGNILPNSGGDVEAGRRAEAMRRTILRLQDNLSAIEKCRKPVLAAIHSTCIGGGVDLTSCCDMRYCSEDAWFSIKEIELGMVADVGTLQRLPRLIGDGMVRELAYTGRRLEAAEARELGFVNRVYADREALLQGVTGIARDIAAKSPLAVRGSKEMILYGRDHSVADGLNYIATWNAAMLSQQDLMGSVQAQGRGESIHYQD